MLNNSSAGSPVSRDEGIETAATDFARPSDSTASPRTRTSSITSELPRTARPQVSIEVSSRRDYSPLGEIPSESILTQFKYFVPAQTLTPVRDDAVALLMRVVSDINEKLLMKQVDFDEVLYLLSLLHALLSCSLLFSEAASAVTDAALSRQFTNLISQLGIRCNIPLKLGRYRSTLLDVEQTEAVNRVTLALQGQIKQAKTYASQLETLWYLLRVKSDEIIWSQPKLLRSDVASSGMERRSKLGGTSAPSDTASNSDSALIASIPIIFELPCHPGSRLKYRCRLVQALMTYAVGPPTLSVTSIVLLRLMDSLQWLISSGTFSTIFSSPYVKTADSVNPVNRLIPISRVCLEEAITMSAIWNTLPHGAQSRASLLVKQNKLPPVRLPSLQHLHQLQSLRFRQFSNSLCDVFLPELGRRCQLKPEWLQFLARVLRLYIHFALLIISTNDRLARAAATLTPFLLPVIAKLQEHSFPTSAATDSSMTISEERAAKRLPWTSSIKRRSVQEVAANEVVRTRSLSDTSSLLTSLESKIKASINDDIPLISLPKRAFNPDWRPTSNNFSNVELTSSMPLGFSLLSPSLYNLVINITNALPSQEPIALWALICICESQPDVSEIVRQFLSQQANQRGGFVDGKKQTDSSELVVDWLVQCAMEGVVIFDNRLDPQTFKWAGTAECGASDISSPVPTSSVFQRRDDFFSRGESVLRCLSLRFWDIWIHASGNNTTENDTHELIAQKLRNQESLWASAFVRVAGDALLQATFENGIPVSLATLVPHLNADRYVGGTAGSIDLNEMAEVRQKGVLITQTLLSLECLSLVADPICQAEDTLSALETCAKSSQESAIELNKKIALLQNQLTNLIEGPVSRHTNQIKSFIDGFDSTGAELRKLNGIVQTQATSTANQLNDIRKALNQCIAKTMSDHQGSLAPQQAQPAPPPAEVNGWKDNRKLLVEEACSAVLQALEGHPLLNDLVTARMESHFRENKKMLENLKHDVLLEFQGMESKTPRTKSGSQRAVEDVGKMSEQIDKRFEEVIATVDDRFHRWASSQQVDDLHSMSCQLLERIQSLESKVVITESALSAGSIDKSANLLTARFKEFEARADRERETEASNRAGEVKKILEAFELALMEKVSAAAVETKKDASDLVASLKKKIKHEYIAQLIAKTNALDAEISHLRESSTDRIEVDSIVSTIDNLSKRANIDLEAAQKETEQVRWQLMETRRSLTQMLSASVTDLHTVKSDNEKLRRDQDETGHDLKVLQTLVQNLRAEKSKSDLIIETMREQQAEVVDRLQQLESSNGKKKLGFWPSSSGKRENRVGTIGNNKFVLEPLGGTDISPSASPPSGQMRNLTSRNRARRSKSPTGYVSASRQADRLFASPTNPTKKPGGDTVEVLDLSGGGGGASVTNRPRFRIDLGQQSAEGNGLSPNCSSVGSRSLSGNGGQQVGCATKSDIAAVSGGMVGRPKSSPRKMNIFTTCIHTRNESIQDS